MTLAEPPPEQAGAIIESILLTAEEPVTVNRLSELLEGYKARQIRDLVDELNTHYQEHGHGVNIVQVAGGYQFATRPDLGPWVRRFHRHRSQVRLSQAALEALAIIAFKQPITRAEIDSIRGVNSAGVVQKLMELDLIRITGRPEGIGRPMLFGTTKEFLVHFGLNSLSELPKPRELEELLAEGERKAQESQQLALGLEPAKQVTVTDPPDDEQARSGAETDPAAGENAPPAAEAPPAPSPIPEAASGGPEPERHDGAAPAEG